MATEGLAIERQNVGPGWQPLIDELDAKLRAIDPDYRVAQIKEKFGGLRYYVSFSEGVEWRSTYDVIGAVEERSFTICEDCGSTEAVETKATRGRGGWWRTLCGACREREEVEPRER